MSEKEYKVAVFIGRFQPFHNEHLNVLNKALEIADKVLVVIGSYRVAPNTKNPFTYEERVEMITSLIKHTKTNPDGSTLTTGEHSRVHFIPVRDYYYNDNLWCAEVQQKTSAFINTGDSVAIVGAYKDASSYYLNLFPQWEFVPIEQKEFLSSTSIRAKMFWRDTKGLRFPDFNPYHHRFAIESLNNWKFTGDLPAGVADWVANKYMETRAYHDHVQEYNFLEEYRKKWEAAPFVPTFVTTDAVVICSGHVLVVKRKFNPGKGLWALPGGFLKANESIEDGAIRELREETGIDVPKAALKTRIKDNKVFDYPGRSLRGRTITHAFCIELVDKELPRVKASSDAAEVRWMPIYEVYNNQEQFFEDHFFIIETFIQKS